MGFIKEKISEEDSKKYELEALGKDLRTSSSNIKYKWAIDRDKNIFLIWLGQEREEEFCRFLLWWNGQVITISISYLVEGDISGVCSTRWEQPLFAFPDDFTVSYEDVVTELKEALIAYKWPGYDSKAVSHTAVFKF